MHWPKTFSNYLWTNGNKKGINVIIFCKIRREIMSHMDTAYSAHFQFIISWQNANTGDQTLSQLYFYLISITLWLEFATWKLWKGLSVQIHQGYKPEPTSCFQSNVLKIAACWLAQNVLEVTYRRGRMRLANSKYVLPFVQWGKCMKFIQWNNAVWTLLCGASELNGLKYDPN